MTLKECIAQQIEEEKRFIVDTKSDLEQLRALFNAHSPDGAWPQEARESLNQLERDLADGQKRLADFNQDAEQAEALPESEEGDRLCAAMFNVFVTEDWPAPIYAVRLAQDAGVLDGRGFGHAYKYYLDGATALATSCVQQASRRKLARFRGLRLAGPKPHF